MAAGDSQQPDVIITSPTNSARWTWDESVEVTPLGFGWDAEVAVLEWFGPGCADLLVSANASSGERAVRVYRALAASGSRPCRFDSGTAVPALSGLRCLAGLPNGRSSRFDLIALAESGLVLLPNEGTSDSPLFSARHPLPFGCDLGIGDGRVVQIIAQDWDGDDRVDLVVGFDDLGGYWPDSPAIPVEQQMGLSTRGFHPGFNQKGEWRGRAPRGRVFWLRNVGSVGAPKFEPPVELGAEASRLAVGLRPTPQAAMWGGKSGWEFLVSDARGEVRPHRNFGGQKPPELMDPRPLKCAGKPLVLPDDRTNLLAADLDGDQRVELIYGRSDGRVFAVHAASGRDEVDAPEPVWQERSSLWFGGRAVVAAGDLDADGGIDLIVGDASGRVWWIKDEGGQRYALPAELEAGGLPFRIDPGLDGLLHGPASPRLGFACPALADWSAHGRPDVLVGGAGGEVIHLRNNGHAKEPRFDVPKALRCDGGPLVTPPRVRPAVARWQPGELPDLISLDLQGFLCLYPRTGTHEVGPPKPLTDRLGRYLRLDGGFGRSGRCALWAGDWTGQGHVDLLVGLPRGSRHAAAALLGRDSSSVDQMSTVLLLENAGRNTLIPREIRRADGSPIVVGDDGCSPCGVAPASGGAGHDLLVGSDCGVVEFFARGDLRW